MANPRILIVEDEGLVSRDIENMVKGLGYTVCGIVSSGEEAIEKALELKPDLVLMDIVIKGAIDGISAAEKIWEAFNIPVVYVTAYADETTLKRAKITEPFGYLLKPFDERELKIAIDMALYRSAMDLKLREREHWLSTIILSIGDAVIATNKDGTISFMNPLAERLTGWNQKEALSQPLHEIYCRLQEDPAVEIGLMGEKPPESRDVILLARNGTRFPIEESVAPILVNSRDIFGNVLVFRDITQRKMAEKEVKDSWARLQKALEGTIQAMALTIEIRDPYTAGHQRRVSKLSCAIGRHLNLPPDQVQGIRVAGDIHDIGKISVPAEILSKPGQISDIEYNIIKMHPQIGYDILKTIEFPWPIAQIVLEHHERLNGSGYPAGLKGDQTLIEARILSVADSVEAMSSHRPYRPAKGIDVALEEINKYKGILYDKEVVDVCVQVFRNESFAFD